MSKKGFPRGYPRNDIFCKKEHFWAILDIFFGFQINPLLKSKSEKKRTFLLSKIKKEPQWPTKSAPNYVIPPPAVVSGGRPPP